MNKRKILIIASICILILTIIGSTVAFFGWRADDALVSVTVSSGIGSCDRISDNEVLLEPTTDRERGRIIKLSSKQLTSNRASITWNLVVNNIDGLQHESFRYELINSTTGVSYGSGSFENINDESNSNTITFFNNEEKLKYDEEYVFVLYLWIDGVNFNNPYTMGGKDFDFDMNCTITGVEEEYVEVPTCNVLTYNGNSQTLISSDSTEYTLTNNTGTNAGEYNVTATLNEDCIWTDGATGEKVVTCNINKKNVTVTTLNQTIIYGNNINSSISNISSNGLLESDTIEEVTLRTDVVNVGTGKISTNSVKILNANSADVTSNYNVIKNNTGLVTIKCANMAEEPNVGNVMYTGSEVTGVSGGSYITITGSKVGTEAGTYTAVAKPNENYCWSDGTTGEKEYTWNIQYVEYEVILDRKGAIIGTEAIYGRKNDGIYLDNGHTKKMDSESNPITLPSKTGYTFAGYYTEENGNGTLVINTEGYLVTDIPNTTTSLYAKWIAHTYTINFYDNLNYVYNADTVIAKLGDKTYYKKNNGHALVAYVVSQKWVTPILVSTSKDAVAYYISNGTTVTDASSFVYNGVTYYYPSAPSPSEETNDTSGLNIKKYTYTLNLSESMLQAANQLLIDNSSKSQNFTYGTSAALISNTYTKTGFTFKGWSTSPTGDVIYTDKQSVSNLTSTDEGIINLYAIWEANKYRMYNDHYIFVGNTSPQEFKNVTEYVSYGTEYIPQNITPPAGYHSSYKYYYYEFYDDGSYSQLGNGQTSVDPILVIKGYTINHYYYPEQYQICYDANGGSGAPACQTKYYGTTLILSDETPTYEGHTFLGWNENGTATTPIYQLGGEYTENASKTLKAVWKLNEYPVWVDHYLVKNGSNNYLQGKSETAQHGSTFTPSNYKISVETGYQAEQFGYYYRYSDGSYSFIDVKNVDGGSFTVTQEMIVNIYYKPINYSITYNLNGGTVSGNPTSYNIETESFKLNDPTRTGYTFVGWTGTGLSSATKPVTISKGSTGNKSYTANWSANSYTYNIVYKSSSGTQLGTATITKNYGTTNTVSPKSFAGYTSPSSQSVKWDSTTAKTITFTYTPKSYTYNIVYKSSSGTQLGTATITKNYGTTNTVSPKSFTGYTSPSSQSVTWDSTTAKTITFTYTPKSYKITENHYYLKWQNSTWTLHQTKSYTKDYGTKFSPSNVTPPTGYYATKKYVYYLTSDTNQNILGEGTVGTNSFTVTDNLSVNVYYEPLVYDVVQTFHYYDSSQGWVQYGSDTVDHVYYGQTFTPYAYYTISGKTPLQFDWWTDGTLTGTGVDLGSTITVKGKVVVHVLYW